MNRDILLLGIEIAYRFEGKLVISLMKSLLYIDLNLNKKRGGN